MSTGTVAHLRAAVADPDVAQRYRALIARAGDHGDEHACWLWTGAIAGKGHGRFSIADDYRPGRDGQPRRRRTYVVIAHRFGYALEHGVDALLDVPLLAHRCDNPLCQNPHHWRESDHTRNALEYANRRHTVRGALTDTRGARGRARAIRDAARRGLDPTEAVLAGLRPVHRDQLDLFEQTEQARSGE